MYCWYISPGYSFIEGKSYGLFICFSQRTSMMYSDKKWLISLYLFLQINLIFSSEFSILSLLSNIYLEAILELMRCKEKRACSLTQHFKLHFMVSIIFNGRWGSNFTEYHCNSNSSYCVMYIAFERERHIIFHLGQSAWLSLFGKIINVLSYIQLK